MKDHEPPKIAHVTRNGNNWVVDAKIDRSEAFILIDLFKTSSVTFRYSAEGMQFESDCLIAVSKLVHGLKDRGFELQGDLKGISLRKAG